MCDTGLFPSGVLLTSFFFLEYGSNNNLSRRHCSRVDVVAPPGRSHCMMLGVFVTASCLVLAALALIACWRVAIQFSRVSSISAKRKLSMGSIYCLYSSNLLIVAR